MSVIIQGGKLEGCPVPSANGDRAIVESTKSDKIEASASAPSPQPPVKAHYGIEKVRADEYRLHLSTSTTSGLTQDQVNQERLKLPKRWRGFNGGAK